MAKNVLLAALLAVAFSAVLGGCASNGPCPGAAVGAMGLDASRQLVDGQNYYDGLVDTKTERASRINLIRDIEDREFQDDMDTLLLLNHNSYLTYWHPGVLR
jgi:hypothetical protein